MKKFLAAVAVVMLVAFAAPAFAATNPFMDVPAGHWAYDAVAQLASRGVASDYPDGSYKGAQPATRYEMASMIARVLANVDMEKASKQDVELLKRLILEFKNELDALGVKVNDLDKRVAVLEDGVGSWKVRGIFRLDATFGNNDYGNYYYTQGGLKNGMTKERFRLFLTKTLDENTYFYAQYHTGGMGDAQNGYWTHLYIDTKLPWDIGFRAGRFGVDFEGDYGLYTDNDAIFGGYRIDGFRLKKNFGALSATAVIGRNGVYDAAWKNAVSADSGGTIIEYGTHMTYILDLNFQPNEKFFIGATGYWMQEDSSKVPNVDGDLNTYGFYAGYNFTPAVRLKGIYYMQDQGDTIARTQTADDSPNAWKVALDIKQEALKFTSLWVEYSQQDNGFLSTAADARYGIGGAAFDYVGRNMQAARYAGWTIRDQGTSKWLFIQAKQRWNDKWSTFLRYAQVDFDTSANLGGVTYSVEDAKSWGLGVGYQYTPAIYFELAYDQVDHGDYNGALKALNNATYKFGDGTESVIRFRTTINF